GRGQVVVPPQFLADLGQLPVHAQGVLGQTGALGPLAAQLQAQGVAVGVAGGGAPVPGGVVGPASAPVVEHAPGVGEVDVLSGQAHGAVGGAGHLLAGVLEPGGAPGDDHVHALVARGQGEGQVGAERALGGGAGEAQAGALGRLVYAGA